MDKLLIETLSACESSFQKDELAYLALTTKIELPIRDRWAFLLYQRLNKKYNVAREWKRTDLAVLDGLAPAALIELKAMYSFDAALGEGGGQTYVDAIYKDECKARKLSGMNTDIYTVLLSTHPKCHFEKHMYGIVKYLNYINKAVKEFGSAEEVHKRCVDGIRANLRDKNLIGAGELSGGNAFGVDVAVSFWLVKASAIKV